MQLELFLDFWGIYKIEKDKIEKEKYKKYKEEIKYKKDKKLEIFKNPSFYVDEIIKDLENKKQEKENKKIKNLEDIQLNLF